MRDADGYVRPVGFATEPATERRRWLSRIILAAFLIFIAWLAISRVINPPDTPQIPRNGTSTELPGPV